jgi:hypothetical protein
MCYSVVAGANSGAMRRLRLLSSSRLFACFLDYCLLDLFRLFAVCERAFVLADGFIRIGAQFVAVRIVRIEAKHFVEIGDCAIDLANAKVGVCTALEVNAAAVPLSPSSPR